MNNNIANTVPDFRNLYHEGAINIAKNEIEKGNVNYPYFRQLAQVVLDAGNLYSCVQWINLFKDDRESYRLLEVAYFFYNNAKLLNDIDMWWIIEHYYYPPMVEKLLEHYRDTFDGALISMITLDNRGFLTKEQRVNYKKKVIIDGRADAFVEQYNFAVGVGLLTNNVITNFTLSNFYAELFDEYYLEKRDINDLTSMLKIEWLQNNESIADVSNMSARDAWCAAKNEFYNPLLGPEYFKSLVDVIVRENDVQCAKDWVWLFTDHAGKNINDYFKEDVKKIIITDDNDIKNIIEWLRNAELYDDDVVEKYLNYCTNVNKIDVNFLAHLYYAGALNKNNLKLATEQLKLYGFPYINAFINEYNRKVNKNANNLDATKTSINDFFNLLDDDMQIGVVI